MTEYVPSPRKVLRVAGLLGLLLLFIYGASLSNGFVDWDDGLLIVENPIVHEFSFASVKEAFTTYDPELYIPLTLVSYQLTDLIAGMDPFLFHLGNLLLHILNAALVAWFAYLLTGKQWIAAVTSLLFAVHPLHTEAVAWASARKDVLSLFFFLLTLNAYLVFRCTKHRVWYRCSVLMLLLSLLSKVSAIATPLVLLLLDWREGRKIDREALLEKVPFFFLSFIFGVVALGGKSGNDHLLFAKVLIGSKAIVFYLQKLLFPTGLSVLYPFTEPISLHNIHLLIPFLVVMILSLLAWRLRTKNRNILFGWLFFLFTVLPSFSNFAKGLDTPSDIYFASDRYAYMPSVGLLFLAALLFHHLLSIRPKLVQGLVAATIVLFAFQAHAQSLVWKNSELLFTHVLAYYPNSHVAYNNLGSLRYRAGEREEALEYYRKSLAIRPNGMAYYNLGQYFTEVHETEKAREAYRQALIYRPMDVKTLLNFAAMEIGTGEYQSAIHHLLRAKEIDDSLSALYYNLGVAYGKLGKREEALASLRRALEMTPGDEEVQELVGKLEL
ncbi:hypothetical protein COU76_04370 [Candidatus Peregrinibacteria bacterium CG10_big_fil_rev_8_21_14_0_10_49_10]|nr:MAG: hypothetical protein COU76_04370 [Candidatus Peregrinibacteria bacterium CG10_big_fil_rev_8_21_14_0_10_49_10]